MSGSNSVAGSKAYPPGANAKFPVSGSEIHVVPLEGDCADLGVEGGDLDGHQSVGRRRSCKSTHSFVECKKLLRVDEEQVPQTARWKR